VCVIAPRYPPLGDRHHLAVARHRVFRETGPIEGGSPSPTPRRRPDRTSLQVEATTGRSPGSVDWPGLIFVAAMDCRKFFVSTAARLQRVADIDRAPKQAPHGGKAGGTAVGPGGVSARCRPGCQRRWKTGRPSQRWPRPSAQKLTLRVRPFWRRVEVTHNERSAAAGDLVGPALIFKACQTVRVPIRIRLGHLHSKLAGETWVYSKGTLVVIGRSEILLAAHIYSRHQPARCDSLFLSSRTACPGVGG
jgi:hypothetical protein